MSMTHLSNVVSFFAFKRMFTWLTGLSLSTIVFLLFLSFLTLVLRRKGYGVRLGLACIVLYARHGSRRFPEGVEVRCSIRIVGFIFDWFRGPLIDVYIDRFSMRLRPAVSYSSANSRRPWLRVLHFFQLGVAAVDLGYWATLFRNIVSKLVAYILRFFRIRIEKVRIWKDSDSWEFKVEQFVFSGHTYRLSGCKYCLSINELLLKFCKLPCDNTPVHKPIWTTFKIQRGVEVNAYLSSNPFTVFRHRRFAILDDLRLSFNASQIACQSPHILHTAIAKLNVELQPGRTRSLLAKLPPTGPASRRINKPGLLEYWEGSIDVSGVSIRITAPVTSSSSISASCSSPFISFSEDNFASPGLSAVTPTTELGLFLRLDSFHIDAYGKMAEERSDPMIHTSISFNGCSAGSSSIDALSYSLYEVASESNADFSSKSEDAPGCVESIENLDKIVAAKPELLVWVEEMTIGVDMNCAKHNSSRVDVGTRGGVVAIDSIGLVMLIKEICMFFNCYRKRNTQRQQSAVSDELDGLSSSSQTTSTSSLSSMNSELNSFRIVSDMRHWTFISLCHGPFGDGDTLAIVASCDAMSLSQVDIYGSSLVRVIGSSRNLGLLHWNRWVRTNNLFCEEARFDIQRGPRNTKKIHLSNTVIDWDLDAHSGLQMLPSLFSTLKDIKFLTSVQSPDNGDETVWAPSIPLRIDNHHPQLNEVERRDRGRRSNANLLETLGSWELSGTNTSLTIAFPDGPKLGLSVGKLPKFKLNTKTFVGQHVVLSLQDKKCAYAAEFRMGSVFHTLDKSLEKRTIDLDFEKLVIVLGHDVQFGFLLQDWLLRLRAAIRILRTLKWKKHGLIPPELRKVPMADIHFKCSDLELFFEDNPISLFLTKMLPLMQDEARERVARSTMMSKFEGQLRKIARAEIAGTSQRCEDSLKEKDANIWVERVKHLKKRTPSRKIANGYLPSLDLPAASSFSADSLSFDVVLDDLARQMGSSESIRRMRMLDDYELGPKKYNMTRQYERDAWNSIGFRGIGFEATRVLVQLHDYPDPFVVIDRMYFDNTTMGQAVQATKAPYISQTTVAIGRRRRVKIEKALSPSKTFADIHLKVDTLHSCFNPAFLPAISDFGRDISRFFTGGINPSPRIPWFDSLRFNMHGRMRLTAQTFTGVLTSSTSPYSMTDHYIKFESKNFEMLCSRLQPSSTDPFPICWKFHSWHIRPSNFECDHRSEVTLDFVRVGLNPLISTESGDPQDHYFVPFPTADEICQGGPGIGRGDMTLIFAETPAEPIDNGFGNFTNWWTGLHEIPDFDSFAGFKTQSMILGIDINVRHPKPKRGRHKFAGNSADVPSESVPLPVSSSVLYSDAISTLTKVVKGIVHRPVSCRLPPRRLSLMRKPPSKTGLSTSFRGMDLRVLATDVNIMLYNNLELGHGLFVSVQSLSGELWKRTDVSIMENGDIQRSSRLTRKRFDIIDVRSSIQVPGLDLAVDSDDMGKLLTIDKISLSDNPQDEMRSITSPRRGGLVSPSSGFGSDDLDESPFYTFSANHPLQRGNSLDKVQFDKRLLINGVRLVWSPVRRVSMFAWPDAFKVKTFCMKTHEARFSEIPRKTEHRETVLSDAQSGVSDPKCDLTGTIHSTIEDIENPMHEKINNIEHLLEAGGHGYKSSATLSSDSHHTASDNSIEELCLNSEHSESDLIEQAKRATWTPSKSIVKPKHVGSMVDILETDNSGQSSSESEELHDSKRYDPTYSHSKQETSRCALGTLKSSPKIALYINDCEVVFGSPETIGLVFLRSRAVRIGIVDKHVQKSLQVGQRNEGWIDREYRVHLDAAEVLTKDKANGNFDFGARNWVPRNVANNKTIALVTQNPISMDLMYISSSSLPNEDGEEEEDDYILRPKLLFINIPHIRLSTNACEFHAITDVVRKVLMQSMRSSELVNEELSNLRYKLQLAGGKVTSKELEGFMRQLNSVTRQFLYAGDTFQPHLVEALLIPGETTFYQNLLRYKAKAKALATFLRKDQRATTTDILYPTMYVSYSFDECSWELREAYREPNREVEDAFVGISLEHLVCRHIFYVGRGSSNEITFGNISALNKMQSSYFKRILQPSRPRADPSCGQEQRKMSGIKASDGAPVAFRLYSTQDNRVGGIPVYDLLTIQVAPMTAAVTRKLYSSVSDFIFSTRPRTGSETDDVGLESQETQRPIGFSRSASKGYLESDSDALTRTSSHESGAFGSKNVLGANSGAIPKHGMDDVSLMARRGDSNMLFRYVFIDAFELTASYKNKDTENRSALDVFDLFVRTPSYSYSSQIWSWKDFISQIRRDLAMTFFLRGASNLAKMKLLPGYSRARKRLVRGAGNVKESIYSRIDAGSSLAQNSGAFRRDEDDIVEDGLHDDSDNGVTDLDDHEDAQDKIDAAVVDISGVSDLAKRQRVLKALYGESITGKSAVKQIGRLRGIDSNKDSSSSSHEDNGFRARARAIASGRSRTSSRSQASAEDEPKGFLSRLRRFGHHDS